MPKVASRLGRSVFYLYREGHTNRKTGEPEPSGTGFFVRMGETFHYGITNCHVALGGGATTIRINTHDGGARFMTFRREDWHFIPDPDNPAKPLDDICAVQILPSDEKTDSRNFWLGDERHALQLGEFLQESEIAEYEIGLGEGAFMVGLFAQHDGGRRNVPSARFGNLSMIADANAPVSSGPFRRPAHLIDMRSRSGFSGSPVFLYRTPIDDLAATQAPWSEMASDSFRSQHTLVKLLGIHAGQFNDFIKVRRAAEVENEAIAGGDPGPDAERAHIISGDDLVIPGGMTIVVPSWRIYDLLHLEVFAKVRRDAMNAYIKRQLGGGTAR